MARKIVSKTTDRFFVKKSSYAGFEEFIYTRNGLRVLYVPQLGCSSVTSNIVYHVGSRHEARGKTGIAHMLEHMLFKDTLDLNGKHRTPRYVELQNKGAILNATTWDDRTNYYFMMPAEYLDDMLLTEAERMRGLILTEKAFKPEQQNVLSEYEMVSEHPEYKLGSALASLSFVSHGYGHDTIGHRTDIEGLTFTDLKDFYDTYYWPNNATLVVVGDVERDRLFELVHKNFAGIPRSPNPIPTYTITEPPPMGKRTVAIEHVSPLQLVTYSFAAPKATDPSWAHGHVLLTYLAEGRLSPLYKALVDTHMASSVSAGLMFAHDPHSLVISVTVAKGHKLDDVRARIEKEVKKVREKDISAKDLRRIKNKILADTLFGRDGTRAVASELTECIAAGDWMLYHTILEKIETVTSTDARAFANQFLRESCAIVGTFKGIPA